MARSFRARFWVTDVAAGATVASCADSWATRRASSSEATADSTEEVAADEAEDRRRRDEIKDTGGATAAWYHRMGGSDQILDAYRASVIAMAGMAVAIYAVQILLRMRAEEADGPLEPILATTVSRPRWVMSHVLNAGLGSLALLLVFAVSMGLAAGSVLGDVPAQLRALVEAGLVQLPGIMVIGSVVVAVTALLPRWAGTVSWTVVMVSILLGPLFGAATLQLPQWTQDMSPFTHIPKAPAADVTTVPVVGLLAISAVLAVTGLVAFRRRNLALPV